MPARLFFSSGDLMADRRFEFARDLQLKGDLAAAADLLLKAVLAVRAAAKKPAFFKRAIDLGCGTGLAATAFAKEVDHFTGIDLSPRMVEKSRATGVYAELEVADMLQGLRGQPDAVAD